MQMTDLPTSKAQLVLFIINNFNNCINLNTLFFQCMIVRANIYILPNFFPILNYNKSVVQADLFKLRCESCQIPVINTDSYAYACLSSFPLKRSHDQQNKKAYTKRAWIWKGYQITANQIELLVLSCKSPGMGEIGIRNREYLIAIILCRIFNGRSWMSWVFATDYLGDFCPDFGVPINNTHRTFINIFWVNKMRVIHS